MVRRVSAKEAGEKFSDLIGSVHYSQEPVIVEKQGKPFAVVISVEEFERLRVEREQRFTVLESIWAQNPTLTEEEAMADALREIAAVRAEARTTVSEL